MVELLSHSLQGIVLGMLASHLDRLDGFEGILQLHHLARRDLATATLEMIRSRSPMR